MTSVLTVSTESSSLLVKLFTKMNRCTCCVFVLVGTGLVLCVAAIVLIVEGPKIINTEIKSKINLKDDDTKKNWVKNPTPIYFQLWMWNVTNPEEVKNGGKPNITQRGPYTYRENRRKMNISYSDNNHTVTYREDKYYFFDRDMSVGPESETFTTINIPMMLAANIVKREFSLIQEAIEALLEWANEKLFVKLSVSDLVWGYEDPLLNKTIGVLKALGLKIDIPTKFGIFSTSNGTDDGVYNVKTGEGDSSMFGMIQTWNYDSDLTYWTTHMSNMINGTDGTIFHPFVKKPDILYLFSSDLCRSIYLTHDTDTTRMGIDVYRFVAPPEVFLNHTANPANEGFCTPDNKTCLPSGLLNVENCRDGAPVVFSQPHFLDAAPSVINAVIGVKPDKRDHQTFIEVEPNTGAAFAAAKKLQVNIQLEQVNHIKQTEHLPHIVLPVLWLNESSVITSDLADQFKSQLKTPMEVLHIGPLVALGVGIFIACAASLYLLISKIFAKRDRELVPITESSRLVREDAETS